MARATKKAKTKAPKTPVPLSPDAEAIVESVPAAVAVAEPIEAPVASRAQVEMRLEEEAESASVEKPADKVVERPPGRRSAADQSAEARPEPSPAPPLEEARDHESSLGDSEPRMEPVVDGPAAAMPAAETSATFAESQAEDRGGRPPERGDKQGKRRGDKGGKQPAPKPGERPHKQPPELPGMSGDKDKVTASLNIAKLQAMSMAELNQMARDLGVENFGTMRKHEVIFHILQKNAERAGVLFSEGVLEVLPEGFGFLRSQSFNYLPCPEDIYVSPSQIRRFDLQTGNLIAGQIRPPKEKERFFALLKVEAWIRKTRTRRRTRRISTT